MEILEQTAFIDLLVIIIFHNSLEGRFLKTCGEALGAFERNAQLFVAICVCQAASKHGNSLILYKLCTLSYIVCWL